MWKLPVFEARATVAKADTEVVAVYQDGSKKVTPGAGPYRAQQEKFRKSDAFNARAGSTAFVRFGGKRGAESVLFVGLGPLAELTEEKMRSAGGNAWAKLVHEKAVNVSFALDSFVTGKGQTKPTSEHIRAASVFLEGMVLGSYEFKKHKSEKATGKSYHGPARVTVLVKDAKLKKEVDCQLARVAAIGESVTITRDWSNEPSNYGTPEYFASEAKRIAEHYGLKCKILSEKDCAREKMGLFLGVGQGSEREGKVVVVEYNPKKPARDPKTIALVGKGITFDSGGISIKPSLRMEEMKHDMTGAATVFGATILASLLQVPNRVVTIMGFTENMPDGTAIQPGNVLTGRNGKTVEVLNTDAEGRLILGDLLDFAQDMKPDAVINAATLTGAVSVALGKLCCGIMGNDEELIADVRRAGERNGERIWQLPLFDEYFDDLKSEVADMRNVANDGNGGTIRGAIFLKQFIRKGTRWAHLDIAATAWGISHLSYLPKKGASGLHVRTLAQFAADF